MTHEYQSCIEVLIVLLDVVCIVLSRFLSVNGVEVEFRVVGLGGFEERSKGISEATFPGRSVVRGMQYVKHTTSIHSGGVPFRFHAL